MDKATAFVTFGPVVFESDNFVVRAHEVNNELKVYAHNKNSKGMEELPNGYMIGSNLLIKEKKHG